MPSLFAGLLRHRVTIQAPISVQDPNTGAPGEITWTTITKGLDVAAYVRPPSGRTFGAREMLAANQIQSRIVADITIRYRSDLKPDMRILHRGTIYNISGILPDNDSGLEWLTIPCTSGLNEG